MTAYLASGLQGISVREPGKQGQWIRRAQRTLLRWLLRGLSILLRLGGGTISDFAP